MVDMASAAEVVGHKPLHRWWFVLPNEKWCCTTTQQVATTDSRNEVIAMSKFSDKSPNSG